MFSKQLIQDYLSVTKFLTNAINKSSVANSYVFISKSTEAAISIALHLSKILNCEENKNNFSLPCERCINCNWLNKNEHPQAFITLAPDEKSKKEQIKIDTIRELLNSLANTSNYFRVVFFTHSGLQHLPQESCNLLLKTVEETPERTIFIFTNPTRSDILPTIISRSQIIYINKQSHTDCEMSFSTSSELIKDELLDCFQKDMLNAISKAKQALEHISEHKTNTHNYLISLASFNYKKLRYTNPKQFLKLYKNLQLAYLKHKSFIQDKTVLQDLLLSVIN